ncbi:hypothetical protein GCM10022629_57040 [Amorphoplanes auranticolor]
MISSRLVNARSRSSEPITLRSVVTVNCSIACKKFAISYVARTQPLHHIVPLLRNDPDSLHKGNDGKQDNNSNDDTGDGIPVREPPFMNR